ARDQGRRSTPDPAFPGRRILSRRPVPATRPDMTTCPGARVAGSGLPASVGERRAASVAVAVRSTAPGKAGTLAARCQDLRVPGVDLVPLSRVGGVVGPRSPPRA